MLINNLGSLKAELARYMFHQRFAPDYDTAVQNFESVANRRLRVRQQEAVFSISLALNQPLTLPLPNDYLLWRTVLWTGRAPLIITLEYVHPAYFRTVLDTTGDPKIFRIIGSFMGIWPTSTAGDIQIHYYQKIPTILATPAGDNAANWLINEHPDIYLFGTLFELFVLGRNAEAGQAYKQMRDEKMAELIQVSALTTGATSSQVRGEGSALGSGGEYF